MAMASLGGHIWPIIIYVIKNLQLWNIRSLGRIMIDKRYFDEQWADFPNSSYLKSVNHQLPFIGPYSVKITILCAMALIFINLRFQRVFFCRLIEYDFELALSRIAKCLWTYHISWILYVGHSYLIRLIKAPASQPVLLYQFHPISFMVATLVSFILGGLKIR